MASSFTTAEDPSKSVKVIWYGHSMFLLDDGQGHRLLTDPFAEYVGYPLPKVEADVVLVSHDHADHSNVDMVEGSPIIVRNVGLKAVNGISINGYSTYHDERQGALRGENIVFRWNMQDLTFIHLGDLGHTLERDLVEELANPDVLFIPVGGNFTIDDAQAEEVVKELGPRIAVPMHFRNSACDFPISTEEPFVSRFDNVIVMGKQPAFFSRNYMPETTQIILMDYIS
jgi:L-ascorbate metabolism protein UlaG (beta-lactamase superfamily)